MSEFVSLDYWDEEDHVREIVAARNIEKVRVMPGANGIELVEMEGNARVYRVMFFDSQEECDGQYKKLLAALVEE